MPKYSEPYSNLDEPAPIPLKSVVREIATRTQIRRDIVQEVIESLTEVATEEIVNKGSFNFNKLFTVSSFKVSDVNAGLGKSPAHEKLSIRLSNTIKVLRRLKKNSNEIENETYEELNSKRASERNTINIKSNTVALDKKQPTNNNIKHRDNDDEWDSMFDDDEY